MAVDIRYRSSMLEYVVYIFKDIVQYYSYLNERYVGNDRVEESLKFLLL